MSECDRISDYYKSNCLIESIKYKFKHHNSNIVITFGGLPPYIHFCCRDKDKYYSFACCKIGLLNLWFEGSMVTINLDVGDRFFKNRIK